MRAGLKYAIVTGASPSSIGFLAAKKFASSEFGYKVVLACRSPEKGQEAERQIRAEHASADVKFLQLDLASFTSVRKFVNDFHGMMKDDGGDGQLKLLINNAGVGFGSNTPYQQTVDGLEEIVGVNHFGTFLLTQLLLEDLQSAGDGARIVVVSSSLHAKSGKKKSGATPEKEARAKLILPDFPDGILQTKKETYDGFQAYKVSKLCNLWFTHELQRALAAKQSSVVVNAVSPGFIPTTGLTRLAGWLGTFFLHYVLDPWRHLGMGITRSPEEGAEVMVQAASSDVASKGGQYFELPRGQAEIAAISSSDESLDEAKAKQLWELSIKTCQLE